MKPLLETLLGHPNVWRGNEIAQVADSIPSGFVELDALLPGRGWPRGALTEILMEQQGIGELRLLIPALAKLSHLNLWVVFIAPPYLPYAPALASSGINLSRCLFIDTKSSKNGLWAMEQALRSKSCEAALLWSSVADDRNLRRLQLAAEQGQSLAILFGPATHRTSPAALRLSLSHAHDKLCVHILKRRGSALTTPLFLDVNHVVDSYSVPGFAASNSVTCSALV